MSLIAALGWLAAAALLGAYALLTLGRLTQSSAAFRGLNVLGAAGLVLNGAAHAVWPSVSLNVMWLLIGGAGFLLPLVRSRRGELAASRDDQ